MCVTTIQKKRAYTDYFVGGIFVACSLLFCEGLMPSCFISLTEGEYYALIMFHILSGWKGIKSDPSVHLYRSLHFL